MNQEIEAKLKVDGHSRIIEKLDSLKAVFVQELLQSDYYFESDTDQMKNNDRCLRIRYQQGPQGGLVELTYKGPREPGKWKTRTEIQLEIRDAKKMSRLLNALGYHRSLAIEKKRMVYELDECEIMLDDLPIIGKYIEIEGPSEEKINRIQNQLGLENLEHIHQSYANLLEEAIKDKPEYDREILFNAPPKFPEKPNTK